jgi:CheY-like chemotaxis protein
VKGEITILLADDDEDDRLLACDALGEAGIPNEVRIVQDGVELLDYLYRRGAYANPEDSPRPGLILLDLNMPRLDGREALESIKQDPALRSIPVVALTTSGHERDVARVYDLGANSYVVKPADFAALTRVMQVLANYWLKTVVPPPTPRS